MSYLELRALRKRFGAVMAVEGVSLTVERGELVSLLGPSGCGKTTLLRMVAGLETPDAGAVELDGEDVTALPPYERRMGMVFQAPALFPNLRLVSGARGFQSTVADEFNNMAQLVAIKPGSVSFANIHNHARAAREIDSIH